MLFGDQEMGKRQHQKRRDAAAVALDATVVGLQIERPGPQVRGRVDQAGRPLLAERPDRDVRGQRRRGEPDGLGRRPTVERGEDPVVAAKTGIAEVGMPVIIADLTTIAAYLPMILVPGIMGDFMGVMPKVVSVALLGSVLVDHFLIPVLAARWFRRRSPSEVKASHLKSSRGFFGILTTGYTYVLDWALNNRWAVVTSSILALVWAGAMLGIDPPFTLEGVRFFTESRAFSIAKAEHELGWRPEVDLEEGTQRSVDWYREQGWLLPGRNAQST